MEINRLSGYSDFLGIVEYPAVVFCEDGEVISINNAAVKIVGSDVESIAMEPDKFMVNDLVLVLFFKSAQLIGLLSLISQ